MEAIKVLLLYEDGKRAVTRWKVIPRIGEKIIRNTLIYNVKDIHHDMDNDRIVAILRPISNKKKRRI